MSGANGVVNSAIPITQQMDFINNMVSKLQPNNTDIDYNNKNEFHINGLLDTGMMQKIVSIIDERLNSTIMNTLKRQYQGNTNYAYS